jgi:uncharacterized protein YodC (DUF2158 family)
MADETTFQPGDVVQLKSGGPLVTVVALSNDKLKFTYYYVNEKGLIAEHNTTVLAAAFKKADPPTEPYTGSLPLGGGR